MWGLPNGHWHGSPPADGTGGDDLYLLPRPAPVASPATMALASSARKDSTWAFSCQGPGARHPGPYPPPPRSPRPGGGPALHRGALDPEQLETDHAVIAGAHEILEERHRAHQHQAEPSVELIAC
jgi:hypothetical protein